MILVCGTETDHFCHSNWCVSSDSMGNVSTAPPDAAQWCTPPCQGRTLCSPPGRTTFVWAGFPKKMWSNISNGTGKNDRVLYPDCGPSKFIVFILSQGLKTRVPKHRIPQKNRYDLPHLLFGSFWQVNSHPFP